MKSHTLAKIEPKTFFANERTFIQWLSAALLLLSLSLAMVGLGHDSGRIAGFVVMPVALLFLLYALYVYQWRAKMIRDKSPGPYDDRYGPVALVAALILTVVVLVIMVGVDWDSQSSSSANSIEPSQSTRCRQIQFTGLSKLLFQPSGLVQHNGKFLVPSKNTLVEIPIAGGAVQQTRYGSLDLEDNVIANGTAFLLAENPAAIVQVDLATKAMLATFTLGTTVGSAKVEGLAFVPDATLAATELSTALSGSHKFGGLFLVGTQDGNVNLLDLGDVNNAGSVQVNKVGELNSHLVGEGLTGTDLKISGLNYHVATETLFVLQDNAKQLTAWDFKAGQRRGTWATPGNSKQWEGVLVDGADLSSLTVHLAKDSPPEIWSFDFNALSSIGFASC